MSDPTALAVFHALFASVAEEMGVTLGRTAHSPNIKERRDYSCAVFDAQGALVAQAAHIPVHLGSMPVSVEAALPLAPFAPGDVVILNDPYLGGTHLPDITLVSPVFQRRQLVGFVVSRAHHADVGGMAPGSMPLAGELYQEGVVIPPLRLYRRGRRNQELLALLLRNVRTPEERLGDLDAQLAAHRTGEARLLDLAGRYGRRALARQMAALQDYAERLTRTAIAEVPNGLHEFEDALDDDGVSDEPVPIRLRLTVRRDTMHFDFSGSAPQRPSSVNAVAAVTRSAVYYVARCLLPAGLSEDAPTNAGSLRPISVRLPEASVVAAEPQHAVSAGNVETSQRIVDVVLGALARALPDRMPAASAGTMNNVTIGGVDAARGGAFAYYETLAGGAGAGPSHDGRSAVHTHMTNTMNTPVEALELSYPFRVRRYAVRRRTGGAGRHRGGDGLVREYEFLSPAHVTIVGERRRRKPWGLRGGRPGAPGRDTLIGADGRRRRLPSKGSFQAPAGARLRIETPGGGGWGRPPT